MAINRITTKQHQHRLTSTTWTFYGYLQLDSVAFSIVCSIFPLRVYSKGIVLANLFDSSILTVCALSNAQIKLEPVKSKWELCNDHDGVTVSNIQLYVQFTYPCSVERVHGF